jgi:leader peptidase (prepilin peptidase) / N-methyltransferase
MLDLYHFIRAEHGWVFQLWFFGIGASVGSFLNVCILRIPAGKSIVFPGSHCGCGAPIRWYDNIPIFSWFILRGRARCCGQRFSIRYSLVEATTAAAFLWLWNTQPATLAVPGMVFFSLLLMGGLIDLDHLILPDATTVGGMFAGLILSCALPQIQGQEATGIWFSDVLRGGTMSLVGILAGTGVVFWLRELGELAMKKEAMGYGDVLLMGCIGAFCGWQGALFSVFGGAVLGCLVLLPWMAWARVFGGAPDPTASAPATAPTAPPTSVQTSATPAPTDAAANSAENPSGAPAFGMAVPFGPWLALAGFLYYAGLRPWVDAYFDELQAIIFASPFHL